MKVIGNQPPANGFGLWDQGRQGRAQQDLLAWRPALRQADDDHRVDADLSRARARELVWQEPYGVNALRIQRDAIIGMTYSLNLQIDAAGLGLTQEAAAEWEERAEAEWQRYAEGAWHGADASRRLTFTGLMGQVLASLLIDGEAIAIVTAKEGFEGYSTTLQLIEPERVQSPAESSGLAAERTIRNGVELDSMGEPVAYWILRRYPSAVGWQTPQSFELDYQRIQRMTPWGRYNVLHCFDPYRPGMTRGISPFISVMKQMKSLGAYSDTELERAIMQASFAAVIESELDYEQAMRVLGAAGGDNWGNNLTAAAMTHLKTVAPYHQTLGLKFNGSRVAHLLPGEKLNVVNQQTQGGEYDKFEKAILRQLSAGLGVAQESLSRDFSDTSYSAARMSLADIWRSYYVKREQLGTMFGLPFVSCWLEEAIMTGKLPMPDGSDPTMPNWIARRDRIVRGKFLSWGKPIIDPVKEATGAQQRLSLGLTTLEEEAAGEGKDWRKVLRQRKQERDYRESLGLNIGDIDPTLSAFGAASGGDKVMNEDGTSRAANKGGRTTADGAE